MERYVDEVREGIAPQIRVPHLRDGFIVDKVGIVRSTTAFPPTRKKIVISTEAAHASGSSAVEKPASPPRTSSRRGSPLPFRATHPPKK
jgi:hypothetical protein